MALQLFVKRKAKGYTPIQNNEPACKHTTDWTNHTTLCFHSSLRQCERKLGKSQAHLHKRTKCENIATTRENVNPVFSIFDYLFTNLLDAVKQTTLGTTSLLLFISDDKEKGQISPSASEIPESLLLTLCLSLHHDAQLTILTLILLILAYKLSLLISGQVTLDPKSFYLFTPIRFVQCVAAVKLLFLDFNVDHKSSDTSA